MADTKDKDSILQIYNNVLPNIAEKAHQALAEIIPLFDDFGLEKVVDTWTKDRDNPSDKPISIDNGNVAQIGLRLQLLGFQRPGIPTFDVAKDLLFKLGYSSYSVGPDRTINWLEKTYFSPWSTHEIKEIVERWTEEIIDAIAQQLPQDR